MGGCRPRHGRVVSDASPVAGGCRLGKTAVAACAALRAIESGFSAVVLAPTEILAEQHYRVFGNWFSPLGITVHLHTGSKKH